MPAGEKPFGNWFSFSFSAYKTFKKCPRAWWISKVLFWKGWEAKAPESRRLAYRLTKMLNVWTLSGQVIHEIAADLVTGRRVRDIDAARSYYSLQMRYGWNQSQRGDWQQDPKRKVNLFEHYYRNPAVARLFAMAQERGARALDGLYSSEALALAERGRIVSAELLEEMMIGDVPVWIAIDLVVEADGITWVVDWKTGKPNEGDRAQALLYALYQRKVKGVPCERQRLLIAYLDGNAQEVIIPTDADLDALEGLVLERANDIRMLLEPPGEVNRGDAENFPAQTDPAICARCELYHACKGSRQLPEVAR